jgi:type IV secretion system protein VirB1
MLEANGYNYSLGIVQVNRKNLPIYGLTLEAAFDPCANLRVGGAILEDCYRRAAPSPSALTDAFSCYYTGRFSAGYRLGYVSRVQQAAASTAPQVARPIPVVPAMSPVDRRAKHRSVVISMTPVTRPNDPVPLFVSGQRRDALAVVDAATPQPKPKEPSSALLF